MKGDIYIIMDNIRSRENVGSIFRTADGAGVKKIFLCGITPTPELDNYGLRIADSKTNPKSVIRNGVIDRISKTALGAEKWMPWEYHRQTWRLIRKLKSKNEKVKIIGLEKTKGAKDLFRFKPSTEPMVLVVGNEVKGLSPKILKLCDEVIQIPMHGKKESLNVAVAAGVALYTIKNAA